MIAEPKIPLAPGDVVTGNLPASRYELGPFMRRGGYGSIFEVKDASGERYAMKVVPITGSRDKRASKRAVAEMKAVSRIDHINVVRYHDGGFDFARGFVFMVMEYIEGASLRDVLTSAGRLPIERALRIGRQICSGLEAAHREGIIHRDVKPENVMLQKSDLVKVIDFNIAKLDDVRMGTTKPVGTAAYMPPDQLRDPEEPHVGWDIWSTGLVVWELIAGRHPDEDEDGGFPPPGTIIARRIEHPIPSLAEAVAGCPREVSECIGQAVAFDASDRFASAAAFGAALRQCRKAFVHVDETTTAWLESEEEVPFDPQALRPKQELSAGPLDAASIASARVASLAARALAKGDGPKRAAAELATTSPAAAQATATPAALQTFGPSGTDVIDQQAVQAILSAKRQRAADAMTAQARARPSDRTAPSPGQSGGPPAEPLPRGRNGGPLADPAFPGVARPIAVAPPPRVEVRALEATPAHDTRAPTADATSRSQGHALLALLRFSWQDVAFIAGGAMIGVALAVLVWSLRGS